jgi:fluoride exporter
MDASQLRLVGLVGLGGALGSIARYGVAGYLTEGDFPWGTFAVNFSGSFLVAMIFFATLDRGYLSADFRTFLFVGIFGGYTTLSTFGLETTMLLRQGQTLLAGVNMLLNGGLCVIGAVVGAGIGVYLGAA